MVGAQEEEAAGSVDARVGAVLAAWTRAVVRAPRLVLLLAVAWTAFVADYTARHLGVDTNTAALFAEDLAFRRNFTEFERSFPQFDNTLVMLLDGEDADGAERAARDLAARLRAEPERFHDVFWPQGDPFFARHGLLYLSIEDLRATVATLVQMAPLLRYLEGAPELASLATALGRAFELAGTRAPAPLVTLAGELARAVAAARRGEVAHVGWRGAFVTGRAVPGTRQIVTAQPNLDFGSLLPSGPAIARARALGAELGFERRGVRMQLTGDVALANEELDEASRGAAMAGVLSLVLVSVFLIIGLRSVRMVVASLLTLGVGLVWTAGWAAATVGHLNLISVAFAVLYISLGVDFSIHLCLRFRELLVHGHAEGLAAAAGDVGGSLLLAALTTALGFVAFVPTEFTGVAELGVIAGGGVLISLLANLTVLPALLSLSVLRPSAARVDRIGAPGAAVVRPLRLHGRMTRQLALLAGALAVCALPWARFDANPLHLRSPEAESVRAFRELARDPETTPYSVSVLARDGEQATAVAQRLAALESVAGTLRLEDFVPVDQDAKLAILDRARGALAEAPIAEPGASDARPALGALAEALRRLPDDVAEQVRALRQQVGDLLADLDRQAPAERSALLERVQEGALGGLPPALESLRASLATGAVSTTDLPADLRARWEAPDGRRRVEARPREELSAADALQRFARSVLDVAHDATGAPIIVTESARVAVESFRVAFAYALAAMTIVLLLILRSARDVVLILIPLGLAGLLTVAAMTVAGVPFNFANVIGLPLLLGTSVDNGIHIVHRCRVDPAAGAQLLRTSTARAVLFSSLTTLGGFGTLIVSPHPGTASLGLLLCVGILSSLVCTLALLPVLLVRPTS